MSAALFEDLISADDWQRPRERRLEQEAGGEGYEEDEKEARLDAALPTPDFKGESNLLARRIKRAIRSQAVSRPPATLTELLTKDQ